MKTIVFVRVRALEHNQKHGDHKTTEEINKITHIPTNKKWNTC